MWSGSANCPTACSTLWEYVDVIGETAKPIIPNVAKPVVAVQTKQTCFASPIHAGIARKGCPVGFVNAMEYAEGGVIGSWKCANAADIVRLWIPAEVRIIGNCAFRACENLEEVEFENCGAGEPLSVGVMAFAACPKLTRVHLSERLVSLGDGAFRDCTMLSQFSIPQPHGSIRLGGVHVFDNCPDKDVKTARLV